MIHFVKINKEEDLLVNWFDLMVPHMSMCFQQINIDQCIKKDGYTYASYEPLELKETITWETINGPVTVPPGVYFIHPKFEEF